LYYCTREPDYERADTKLIFHRGNKDGPIIATAEPCPRGQKYRVDIHYPEKNLTIPFEHKHGDHSLLCSIPDILHFRGPKGEAVGNEGTVAIYRPSAFEGHREVIKLGDMEMTLGDKQDLIVVTALTAQEREEETKSPVCSLSASVTDWVSLPCIGNESVKLNEFASA
jgi:hypothetical protein